MKSESLATIQKAFEEFNFTAKPVKSALDHLVQEELLGCNNKTSDGLFIPLPFQTGIGKTHTAINTLLEELVHIIEEPDSRGNRVIYYITNSVDNVRQTYKEMIERIRSQEVDGKNRFTPEQIDLLASRLIYLPRQDTQLLETDRHHINNILDAFDLARDPIISNDWQRLKSLSSHANSHKEAASALSSTLSDIASKLYSLITDKIQARQRSKNPLLVTSELQESLDQLYPGDKIRRNEANVVFMTTHKFLYGYQTLLNRCKPIRNLTGSLLIIDEVDRQNEIILQVMIEQRSIDLIRTIRTLHVNLQEHELENSPRYAGVDELFSKLKDDLKEFATQWNLQHAFNTEGDTFSGDSVRLFSDRSFTHVNSASHYLRLDSDPSRQKNIIKSDNRKEIDSTGSQWLLSKFVNRADQLFQQFLKLMRQAVWQYWQNISNLPATNNERRTADGTFQEAVSSILVHYNLEQFSSVVFEAFDAHIPSVKQKQGGTNSDIILSKRSYHERGFKLVDIGLNDGTRDTVNCQFTGLPLSPSGLIVNLVNAGAKILGISATANAETVVRNFDFEYLKERLGSKFISLTSSQRSSVQDYYQSRRDYKKNKVAVVAEFVNTDITHLEGAINSFLGQPARKPGLALQTWLNTDTDVDFVSQWVSKLLQTMERFISLDSNRYMLALTNRTINITKHKEFVHFLEEITLIWSKKYNCEAHLYTGIDAAAMKEGAYDEILCKLENTESKVIVLSTYASMGEGKNPDYKVTQKSLAKTLTWVGSGPRPTAVRSDIDFLYLEKPTNLLIEHSSPNQRRLALFHQVLSLQERGYISPQETVTWIRSILKNENRLKSLERYYATADYDSAIRKLVEQAVGRTARTAFKQSKIFILSDAAMLDTFSNDFRAPELFSHEYNALVTSAKAIYDTPRAKLRDESRLCNLAVRNNKDTNGVILDLVKRLHSNPTNEDIERWTLIRQEVLSHPTRNEQSEYIPRFYLQSDNSEKYCYEGAIDENTPFSFRFFDDAKQGNWVSETDSSLPTIIKNETIKSHFENNGFATEWRKNNWLLTPTAYNNVYKGALGEESAIAILKHFGLEIRDVDSSIFERFDFIAEFPSNNARVCVDAKHWRTEQTLENHNTKAGFVEHKTGIKHFVYINLIGGTEPSYRYLDNDLIPCSPENATVFELSGLINSSSSETHTESILALIDWMGGLR
jgi:hypothetical protein